MKTNYITLIAFEISSSLTREVIEEVVEEELT